MHTDGDIPNIDAKSSLYLLPLSHPAEEWGTQNANMAAGPPPRLLTAFMSYVLRSDDFQSTFATFFARHTPTFDGYVHGTSENRLEFSDIYARFAELFETKVGAFLDEENATVSDLYSALRDWRSAAGGVAAYEVADVQEFVEAVLAVTDYSEFAMMMSARAEARRYRLAARLHLETAGDEGAYREAEALNPHFREDDDVAGGKESDGDGDAASSKVSEGKESSK